MEKESPLPMNPSSADKSELGFEYQFLFFLWKLLEMKKGETVSWEVKDDVSLDLPDGTTYLFQIKHTTQKNSEERPINLTDLDSDLWKTLSNWSQLIATSGDLSKQKAFLEKTFFVLATNKGEGKRSILIKIDDYKIDDFSNLKSEIANLQSKTTNETIKRYIANCLQLDDNILSIFFEHLQFQLEENDLIQRCKDAIEEKMIPKDKVHDVYDSLYSNIRNDNYITINNGDSVRIVFEEFHKKYRRCFEKYRSGDLVINRDIKKMPDKINEQVFIKQLVDIGDVNDSDFDSQIEFTRFKLWLERNLEDWHQSGEITGIEKNEFLEDAVNKWKNENRQKYRVEVDPSSYNEKGCQIIDELRTKILKIKDQDLPTDMSNGAFYSLADIPKIGFVKDWKDKYEK